MSPQAEDILALFHHTGAFLKGHFRLTSGLHSDSYLQCARLLQYPDHAALLGARLAASLRSLLGGDTVDAVAAPALGGLIIGHEVARHLSCRFIFTERDASGAMQLRRGFSIDAGERLVVVEDVITTGGSTREVIQLLVALGARVLAAGAIVDRSAGAASLPVPRAALLPLHVNAWPAEACDLCRQGVPLLKPGSRPA